MKHFGLIQILKRKYHNLTMLCFNEPISIFQNNFQLPTLFKVLFWITFSFLFNSTNLVIIKEKNLIETILEGFSLPLGAKTCTS